MSLATSLDETEFLSPYGIRSLSRITRTSLCVPLGGQTSPAYYLPAESNTGMFGGTPTGGGRSDAGLRH